MKDVSTCTVSALIFARAIPPSTLFVDCSDVLVVNTENESCQFHVVLTWQSKRLDVDGHLSTIFKIKIDARGKTLHKISF